MYSPFPSPPFPSKTFNPNTPLRESLLYLEFIQKGLKLFYGEVDEQSVIRSNSYSGRKLMVMVSYLEEDRGCPSNGGSTQIALEVDFHLLSNLPEQLLVEILIRLPNESAFRFKAVCKKWCCLISSKYFVSRYLNHRCQDTPKSFTLVLALTDPAIRCPIGSICMHHVKAVSNHPILSKLLERKSFNSSLKYQFYRVYKRNKASVPYQPPRRKEFSVEASCHDLLLLSDSFAYCLVNMHTTKFIMVPPTPQRVCFQRKAGLLCCRDYGDRCCSFKVILVYYGSDTPQKNSSQFSIDIYSSETREWSVVNVRRYSLESEVPRLETPIISHDRMLYWINRRSLVSLDPFCGDRELRLAQNARLPKKHYWLLLGVCCGRIRLVGLKESRNRDRVVHVWDLNNNKLWLLSHSFKWGSFTVLAIHPYDSDVIFVKKADVIYLYNMRSDILEEYHKMEVEDCKDIMVVGSVAVVLHQWFPTPISSHNRVTT